MGFWKRQQTQRSKAFAKKQLRVEQLEDKRLLAIVWANELGTGTDDADFDDEYLANEVVARTIVNRAIDDWNAIITDQDFDNDSNPLNNNFQLKVFAEDFGTATRGEADITTFTTGGAGQTGWTVGVPMAATITLDDDGGGNGWFFDSTPSDDAEFTGIVNEFQASFVDATNGGAANYSDFYRTVVHEIGHAIGLTGRGATGSAIAPMIKRLYTDSAHTQRLFDPADLTFLLEGVDRFHNPSSSAPYGVTATFLGSHLYEGDLYGPTNEDPTIVYEEGSSTPITFETHPNELMNPGRSVPAGAGEEETAPIETTRQLISDFSGKRKGTFYFS